MIEFLERQKKLTANQWKLICTANVADLLDFFDFFLIGYVTAALTKEWSLTYWQGGAILLGFRSRRGPGRLYLGLARRPDRPAHGVHLVGGHDLAGHRHHGLHAGTERR